MDAISPEACQIVLPDALIRLFPEADRRFGADVGNVNELIDFMEFRWPGMGSCLRDSRPAVRKHISIFVEGERAQLSTPVKPGSTVFVLLAISGG